MLAHRVPSVVTAELESGSSQEVTQHQDDCARGDEVCGRKLSYIDNRPALGSNDHGLASLDLEYLSMRDASRRSYPYPVAERDLLVLECMMQRHSELVDPRAMSVAAAVLLLAFGVLVVVFNDIAGPRVEADVPLERASQFSLPTHPSSSGRGPL